jgi:hypothetical protein
MSALNILRSMMRTEMLRVKNSNRNPDRAVERIVSNLDKQRIIVDFEESS